jgi:hypothetical protein
MLGVTVPFLFVWSRGKLFHGANATLATRSLCSVHLYDHLFLLRVVAMMAEEGELGGIDGDGWRKKKDEEDEGRCNGERRRRLRPFVSLFTGLAWRNQR